MIAAFYTQGRGLTIGQAPVPEAGEDGLLIRVEAAAICGTDTKMVQRGHRKLRPGQRIILGHEFVGRIAEAGRQAREYPVGLRVGVVPNIGCGSCPMCTQGLMNMCPDYSAFGIDRDGAHTEYVRIPAPAIVQGNVIPLAETLAPTDAVLAEPLSCAINGVRAARVGAGDWVVIYGAGPMGLLNLMVAAISGAARLVVVDQNLARLDYARQLGATDTVDVQKQSALDWVRKQTGGRGVNVVITAVPARAVQEEAVQLLGPFGRLSLFAGLPSGDEPVPLDTNLIHYRNLLVTGTTGGSPRDYRAALQLIQSGRIPVAKVVSDTLPMQDLERAYGLALSGQRLKILLTSEASNLPRPGRKRAKASNATLSGRRPRLRLRPKDRPLLPST